MGQGSSTSSIARYSNDYELVIRASKALEQLLEEEFNAADVGGATVHSDAHNKRVRNESSAGLQEKISRATTSNGEPLPPALIRQMRYLATIRNRLVHERGFDTIPDRAAFVTAFDSAEAQLRALLPERDHKGGCAIS